MAAGTDALSGVVARKPKRRQYEDARERDGQRPDGVRRCRRCPVAGFEACQLVLELIVASRDEYDGRRRQVDDVGREVLRNVTGFFSRPMPTFPVSDGWDTTFQHGPQTSELVL